MAIEWYLARVAVGNAAVVFGDRELRSSNLRKD